MNLRRFHSLFLLLALPVGAMAAVRPPTPSSAAAFKREQAELKHPVTIPETCSAPAAKVGMWKGTDSYLSHATAQGHMPYTPRLRRIVLIQNERVHHDHDGRETLECPIVVYAGGQLVLVFKFEFDGSRSGEITGLFMHKIAVGTVPRHEWQTAVTDRGD